MEKYKYIVSLGHFCSPAMEFEKIERRPFSLPFDWLITAKLSTVIELINNGFKDFLNEEYLFQLKEYPQYYRNKKYAIDFYHDFSPFISLESQIDEISKKYIRRIERFYNIIKQPTLFLRYITEKDVEYISKDYEYILNSLKAFNPQNDVIFVANNDICLDFSHKVSVFQVEKDLNDCVSRCFLDANKELLQYILSNTEAATTKKPKQKNKRLKLVKKIYKNFRLKLKLVYCHSKQCSTTEE
ncbi:MAG: hypothetical protein IJ388_02860 [Oscillospiraceae bacterium]|nr:hypothetical protein [Oscillospiraceae bacterium]